MSEACERFTREGLAQLEEGAALDPHFDACVDCGAARRAYAKVVEELARPRDVAPAPGWEGRVFDQIAARARRRPRVGRMVAVAAALAAAVAAPSLFSKDAPPALPLRLSVEVLADPSAQLRGQSARPGDRLALRAQVPAAAAHAELRVWRENGELVLRCPGAEGCRREGNQLVGELKLPAVGRYHALVASGPKPLPAALPRFADDAAALLQAGAAVETAEPVDVY